MTKKYMMKKLTEKFGHVVPIEVLEDMVDVGLENGLPMEFVLSNIDMQLTEEYTD